jgi:predicted protein tyrosine phosphatase
MIIVCGLNAVETQVELHGARSVISLLGPETAHRKFPGIAAEYHLQLTMHDIAAAAEGFSAPQAADAERLIAFIQGWDREAPLLIHCWAGISRSTASAFIALCMLRPDEDEVELARELRAASPSASPNPLIVAYADTLLGRGGRMSHAIETIGRGANAFEGTPFTLAIISSK